MSKTALLDDRALLAVTGDVAKDFLQNLVTCDVEKLSIDQSTFGALLTPQGKILFEFLVTKTADGFLLDCRTDMRDDLLKRLMFYKLRAAVDLTKDERKVFASWGDPNGTDPRAAMLGIRSYTDHADTNASCSDWHHHRISNGIPELGVDFISSSVFPHEAMMDQFTDAGVDFTKGCYVGQEVVSRMQHRGTTRSRFVQATGNAPLPELGTEIVASEKTIGKMGSSQGSNGLALVRLDRAVSARDVGATISCAEVELELQLPSFFNGDWPS